MSKTRGRIYTVHLFKLLLTIPSFFFFNFGIVKISGSQIVVQVTLVGKTVSTCKKQAFPYLFSVRWVFGDTEYSHRHNWVSHYY